MNKPARRRSSYKKIIEEELEPATTTTTKTSSTKSRTTHTTNAASSSSAVNNIMDSANRKIELQSPEDLTYLINNVRRAATEHINAAFPPVDDAEGQEEDELRVRIEKIIGDYISQTFTLAAPNLSINGFDLDTPTFPTVYLSDPSSPSNKDAATLGPEIQYEPFDSRKRARVEELAREEEDLMREIAALKRKIPAAAAQGYTDGFWEGVRADEEAFVAAREQAATIISLIGTGGSSGVEDEDRGDQEEGEDNNDGGEKRKKVLLEGVNGPLERQEDVEAAYAGVVDTLGRLKREMPATVAKMERARVAGEYVVTER